VVEQRWRDVGDFIRDQRRSTQLSLRKLADRAGVSNPYLSQIERGLRKPSAEILQQIAHALEISAETLYVQAGILDERDIDGDLLETIRRDAALTSDQKKTLTHIYLSFRAQNEADDATTPPEVGAELADPGQPSEPLESSGPA
jgi:transcriptional regulator with XRE-family HTH domain